MTRPPEDAPYRNPALPVPERVADLLGRMTLDEKLAQLGGRWGKECVQDGRFSATLAAHTLQHGIGHISRAADCNTPAELVRLAADTQAYLVEETRLGIPAIFHEESAAGFLAREATCFPMPIGLASTWDPALIEAMTGVIRRQMRAVGSHHTLAPVVDVARDARWGRVEETFGEDPYLCARMGVAYVRGLQTDNLRDGIVCTGKHYAGYGFSEGGLNWAPSHIPTRELLDVFVPPFAALVSEANVASIMNGYQEIDGIPCGASTYLLHDLLRETLGFTGTVVSDYFTLPMLCDYHNIAATREEAARLGLEAGLDVELPVLDVYGEPLRRAVEAGEVGMDLVDRAVRRVLTAKFDLGLFERPTVTAPPPPGTFTTLDDRALARRIAQQSMVLLKNENDLLPLDSNAACIAVIGPGADSLRLLQGDYHYPSHHEMQYGLIADDGGIGAGPTAAVESTSDVAPMPGNPAAAGAIDLAKHFPEMTTILAGICERVSRDTDVLAARGTDVIGTAQNGFDSAVDATAAAEVAIVVVGGKSGLVRGNTSGEATDRATLGLPGVQQDLVEAVVATGTPTVVVLLNGRPLALPWIAEHVPAVLEAWLPGEEGGHAVADVLFGDVNPGGKLPVSLARDAGQMPLYYNHKPTGGRSMFWGDYADLPATPLFPFGHGLSYTTFTYADLRLSADSVPTDGVLAVSATIANDGARAGDEVVQLYVRDVAGSVTRPVRELKGFCRLSLEPGERRTVTFHLDMSQLAFHGRDLTFGVEPGNVDIMIGASSADIRLQETIQITGPRNTIRLTDVVPTRVEVNEPGQ